MSENQNTPVVEVEEAKVAFWLRWWRSGRDWVAELFGAAGAKRVSDLEEQVQILLGQMAEMRSEHNQKAVSLADRHRADLAESNAALMVMLAAMGIEPGEINDVLRANAEEAWNRAQAWEDREKVLLNLLAQAKANKQHAEAVGEQINNVFGWMPLAQETLPSLALPDAPPASDPPAEAA